MELISDSFSVDATERNKQQTTMIELYLNFLRNILSLRVLISTYNNSSTFAYVCSLYFGFWSYS